MQASEWITKFSAESVVMLNFQQWNYNISSLNVTTWLWSQSDTFNRTAKEKSTRWHVLCTQGKACGFTCLTSLASGGVSGICVASMAPPGKVYSRMAHWKTKTIARLTKQLFSSVTTTILALASLLKSLLTFEMSKQVVQAYVSWQTREACDNKETVLFPSSLTTSIFATELSSHFPSQDCILWHICSFMVSLSNHLSHVRRWLKTASAGK